MERLIYNVCLWCVLPWCLALLNPVRAQCDSSTSLSCSINRLNMSSDGLKRLQGVPKTKGIVLYVNKLFAPSPPSGSFAELIGLMFEELMIINYKDPVFLLPSASALQELELDSYNLKTFVAGVNHHLQTLLIVGCLMQRIPEAIANLTRLQTLSLTTCRVKSLQLTDFSHNNELKNVALESNDIRQLVRAQKPLKSIIKLDLSRNLLEQLEQAVFVELPNLEIFICTNNRLKSILPIATPHPSIVHKALKELILSDNGLSDSQLANLPAASLLHTLTLTKNQLTTIPVQLGNKFPVLRTLILSQNRMSEIDLAGLQGLRTLEGIRLSGNSAQRIISSQPLQLPALRSMFLDNNELSVMNFFGCSFLNLTQLDASMNHLTTIPNLEPISPKLSYFDLSGNPLKCSSLQSQQAKLVAQIVSFEFQYLSMALCGPTASVTIGSRTQVCCKD